MNINSISLYNPSFKACLPVSYYAITKDGARKIVKDEQIKNCQRQVVTNLNREEKRLPKNENWQKLQKLFSSYCNEYNTIPYVSSLYSLPETYILTGKDAIRNRARGREIGVALSITREREGKSEGKRINDAKVEYRVNQLIGLSGGYDTVKDKNGEDVVLKVYFTPKYKKDGTLKEFDFEGAKFVTQKEHEEAVKLAKEKIAQQRKVESEKSGLTGKPVIPPDENFMIEEDD